MCSEEQANTVENLEALETWASFAAAAAVENGVAEAPHQIEVIVYEDSQSAQRTVRRRDCHNTQNVAREEALTAHVFKVR